MRCWYQSQCAEVAPKMTSSNFSKYNFENVLVADTRLLIGMSGQVIRPQIVVLNNKLNFKCNKRANESKSCSSSESCCVQIEEPEMRRRSDTIVVEADLSQRRCFANCQDRRRIDVELNARSQLSGKLVVLALTRVDHLMLGDQIKRNPLRCDTETTWAYSRFDPTPTATANETLKQTFYSSLRSNQAPSLLINTIGLHWDSKKLREVVSLAVQSTRNRKHLEVLMTETLLAIQLHCQPTIFSSKNWLSDEAILTPPIKVHLLALINRQVPQSGRTLSKNGREDSSAMEKIESVSARKETQPALESHLELPGDVPIDQSGLSGVGRSVDASVTMDLSNTSPKATTVLPAIARRLDSPSPNSFRAMSVTVPKNLNKIGSKLNETIHLTELDSMRLRLRSNSLLVFTVSSSLVILVYTLCLFIYLKARRQRAHIPIKENQKQPQHSYQSRMSTSHKEVELRQVPNISEPFNLQMPPATRTRLDMMLQRTNGNLRNCSENYQPNQHSGIVRGNARPLPEEPSNYAHSPESSGNNDLRDFYEPRRELEDIAFGQAHSQADHDRNPNPQSIHKSQIAYGTINVVRAIQHAATLARSHLRSSRYRPNLNVILESDVEHLQSPSCKGSNYFGGLLDPNSHHHQYHKANSAGTTYSEQIETLVQNAMSRNCSHNMRTISHNQPTATLFAKPSEIATAGSLSPISRSRILRQVKKQENL